MQRCGAVREFNCQARDFRYETAFVLAEFLTADPEEPGSSALEEARAKKLQLLVKAGVDSGIPTLRSELLYSIAEHLHRVGARSKCSARSLRNALRAAAEILPSETAATPSPSQDSVRAAAQQFNALVAIVEAAGCMQDALAAPLAWSIRAATAASRSREHLDVERLLHVVEGDLNRDCLYSPRTYESLVFTLNRALQCGLLVSLENPGATARTVKCIGRLALRSDVDLEDPALDAAVAACVGLNGKFHCGLEHAPSSFDVADAWLAAHRERDGAGCDGKMPHVMRPRAVGGAARRRNDRGTRAQSRSDPGTRAQSARGSSATSRSSWRPVLDVDPLEAAMREQFKSTRGGVLGGHCEPRRVPMRARPAAPISHPWLYY